MGDSFKINGTEGYPPTSYSSQSMQPMIALNIFDESEINNFQVSGCLFPYSKIKVDFNNEQLESLRKSYDPFNQLESELKHSYEEKFLGYETNVYSAIKWLENILNNQNISNEIKEDVKLKIEKLNILNEKINEAKKLPDSKSMKDVYAEISEETVLLQQDFNLLSGKINKSN